MGAVRTKIVGVNDAGYRVGQYHPFARHDDEMVEAARALHDQGYGYRRIARALGVSVRTVRGWVNFERRLSSYMDWKKVPA